MSISIPTADYSPLYNALRMKQNALEAEYLPQQIELQQQGFELQRKSYNWSKAEAFISLGSQLGVKALGIWEDAKLEEAKGYIQQDASAMEQVIRDMVLNGKYEYAENEDGTKTISLTDEGALKKIYDDRLAAIEEKFKGFGTVQRWAKAASQKMFDEAKSNALNAFQEKAIEERSGNFVQNLEKAVQQAIEAGYEGEDKYATVDALLAGTEWLSPGAKAVARAEAVVKIDAGVDQKRYERTEKILRDVVGKEGVDRALGLVDQGAIKPEWKDKLRAAVRDQAGLSAASYQEAAAMLVAKAKEEAPGASESDLIDKALGTVPPAYRADVEKALRADHANSQHAKMLEKLNRPGVRGSYEEVDKLYQDILKDGQLGYRDIAEQHRDDLDYLDRLRKNLDPDTLSLSEAQSAWKARAANALARLQIQVQGLAHAGPRIGVKDAMETAIQLLNEANVLSIPFDTDFLQFVAAINGADKNPIVAAIIRENGSDIVKALGFDKNKMTLAEQRQVDEVAEYISGALEDANTEEGRILSTEELRKRQQAMVDFISAKTYSIARKDQFQDTKQWIFGRTITGDEQAADLQELVLDGAMDDAVYQDRRGIHFMPGTEEAFVALADMQAKMLSKMTGVAPETLLAHSYLAPERDAQDVTPNRIFENAGIVWTFDVAVANGRKQMVAKGTPKREEDYTGTGALLTEQPEPEPEPKEGQMVTAMMFGRRASKVIAASVLEKLAATYGVPIERARQLAADNGLKVN